MGRTIGDKVPERISVTFTPLNLRDMNESMKNGDFTSVAELVNHAIRSFYDRKYAINPEPEIRLWLVSEEGQAIMREEMNKAWNSNPLTRELRALLEEKMDKQ